MIYSLSVMTKSITEVIMDKIRLGVMGAMRGSSCMKFCLDTGMMELVAICDWNQELLDTARENLGEDITYYRDFEAFIEHDMDAVVLANYANQHAPFAIRVMQKGKHVFSEVLPCQTMQEAVELVEAVEKYGKIYAYGENYCYMRAPYEMRRLYKEGKIGEFEYAEGEYIHNCEDWWASLTYGDPGHWRNNMYSTYYCTHSLGPIVHMTGLRPVSVIGFEGSKNERNLRVGHKAGQLGIEMVTFENGGIAKSIHGGLYRNSVWFSLYGSKGRMETAREDAKNGGVGRIYINADEYSGGYETGKSETYEVMQKIDGLNGQGHGGGDDLSLYNFAKAIRGDKDADFIDVYEALDMFLPGMFAYRSVLKGGIPMEIPNLRLKEECDKWRYDTACTDPEVAKDMLLPSFSKGNPDIPPEVYEAMKKKNEYEFRNKLGPYKYAMENFTKKK